MTSFAPSAAKRSALARPMPDPAPVMIAILPLNAPMILPSARSIAAVDDDCLAGGEAARRARKEHRGARDLARLADAAQRRPARRYRPRIGVFPQRAGELGLDKAGRAAVDAPRLGGGHVGPVAPHPPGGGRRDSQE